VKGKSPSLERSKADKFIQELIRFFVAINQKHSTRFVGAINSQMLSRIAW
jgi:hypothetical protein